MLLKRMTLMNFRPFKGKHEIVFSTDKEKNITLVMAENGAGKTTMVQAFQWILYGMTNAFKTESVLNGIIDNGLQVGEEEEVSGILELEHNDSTYYIMRKVRYKKEMPNSAAKRKNVEIEASVKNKEGKTTPINPNRIEYTIASIMPKSLSSYFFFDGERIDDMAKDVVENGKSSEIKDAVQNILGLSAFTKAMEHLNPKSKDSVIGRINSQIGNSGNQEIKEQMTIRENCIEKIEKNNSRIEEIESQRDYYKKQIEESKDKIMKFSEVEDLQKKHNDLSQQLDSERKAKNNAIKMILTTFSNECFGFMSKKIIQDALFELKDTNNIDMGIPDVRDETIKFLLERKKCICGSDLTDPTSECYRNLIELLKYIPPLSLGNAIGNFQKTSKDIITRYDGFGENFVNLVSAMRGYSDKIDRIKHDIGEIDLALLNSKNIEISSLKNRQTEMENTLKNLDDELFSLQLDNHEQNINKGNAEAEISRLNLQIEKNEFYETKLMYAQNAYNIIKATYDELEKNTKDELEETINDLFRKIYAGGLSITLDDKYKIESRVEELETEDMPSDLRIDFNTAKSYSIIFAFIVGIIDLARKKVAKESEKSAKSNENDIENSDYVITDEYPLVMDAPLSSFDIRRIKNICEVIPNIARQVIIFIKDTDGEIAKKEMMDKIGIEYNVSLVDKDHHLESKIAKVGEF